MGNPEPELADVGRLARRFLTRAVEAARAKDRPLRRVLLDHLGPDAATLPTASGTWPTWDHVNVQVGLDGWLAASPSRRHEIVGIGGGGMSRHMDVSITDFIDAGEGFYRSDVENPSGPENLTLNRVAIAAGVTAVNQADSLLCSDGVLAATSPILVADGTRNRPARAAEPARSRDRDGAIAA